jgi:hypothetical protein
VESNLRKRNQFAVCLSQYRDKVWVFYFAQLNLRTEILRAMQLQIGWIVPGRERVPKDTLG